MSSKRNRKKQNTILKTLIKIFLVFSIPLNILGSQLLTTTKANNCVAGYNSGLQLDQGGIDLAAANNMGYAMILTDNAGTANGISGMINDANSKGVTPILRICWNPGGDANHCSDFKDPQNYANFINNVSSGVNDGNHYVAIAGPNEPKTENWWLGDINQIPTNEDGAKLADYTRVVLNADSDKVTMISPVFNLHDCSGRTPFIDNFLNALGGDKNKLEGYGGNNYGSTASTCYPFDKPLYLTEFGIIGNGDSFDDIVGPYNNLKNSAAAILFFVPFANQGNGSFAKHNIDGGSLSNLIQCAPSAPPPQQTEPEIEPVTPEEEEEIEQEENIIIDTPSGPNPTADDELIKNGYKKDSSVVKKLDGNSYQITYNQSESTITCSSVKTTSGYDLSLDCTSASSSSKLDNLADMNFVNVPNPSSKVYSPTLENYTCADDESFLRYIPPSLKNIISFQGLTYEYEINYAALDCLKLHCSQLNQNKCEEHSYCNYETSSCRPSVDIDDLINESGLISYDKVPALVIPVISDVSGTTTATTTALKEIEQGVYEVTGEKVEDKTYQVNEAGKVEYFYDENGNGRREPTESILTDSDLNNLDISFNKISEVSSYKLDLGWNSLSFPLKMKGENTSEIENASEIISHFNDQGANVTHISTYRSGKFVNYSVRLDDQGQELTFGEDFKILPGEGYFLKNYNRVNASIKGNMVDGGLEILLNPGWNLTTIYHEDKVSFMGFDILKQINLQGLNVSVLSKYKDGTYTNLVLKDNVEYGFDFPVYPTSGYWIKSESESIKKFKP